MCCCIPCWPFADVDFEREPVNRYGDKYHYVFNESTRAWELRDVVSLFAFLVAKFPPKKLGAAAGQVPLRVGTLSWIRGHRADSKTCSKERAFVGRTTITRTQRQIQTCLATTRGCRFPMWISCRDPFTRAQFLSSLPRQQRITFHSLTTHFHGFHL